MGIEFGEGKRGKEHRGRRGGTGKEQRESEGMERWSHLASTKRRRIR